MIKKMVVGTLFEIRQAAEQASIGVLKKHGAYTEAVKAAHKRLIEATDSIPEMKDVRDGIAFHITDTLRNPQELSAMYRILDGLEIERLDNAVEATYDFVSALRQALPS
jgi:hypothetical protein